MKYTLALLTGFLGVLVGNFYLSYPPIEVVEAKEVQIITDVEYQEYLNDQEPAEWDSKSIEKYIREVFPEDPETAVKVAKCESGLVPDIQSHHILSYGREESYGVFQIHARAWNNVAWELGYTEYKYQVEDNVLLARHIYDISGKTWRAWSCYTKNMI